MSLLGYIGQVVSPPNGSPKVIAEPQLRFDEALACGQRIWMRGQLTDPALPRSPGATRPARWKRWRRNSAPTALPTIHVETRIGGHVLQTTVVLDRHGRFDTTLDIDLPIARRGWRLARNRVTYQDRTLEKCCILLCPPENASGAVVVILPLSCSCSPKGPQFLARSPAAAEITPILRQLRHSKDALYYLACTHPGSAVSQSELALATTMLGWPAGNVILLPAGPGECGRQVAQGLERLRWLFAGNLPLRVLNMEPSFAAALRPPEGSSREQVNVGRFINPGDDPRVLLAGDQRALARSISCLRPVRAGLVPRLPVVFCHGMLAFSTLRMQLPENSNCFSALRDFLHPRGYRALYPQVAPTGGIALRAEQLREQILRWTDEPVNLIAHSMGGLDARYMITHLGMAERVRSLTTVSTPHRGTYLVDWFLTNYRERLPLFLALEAAGFNIEGFKNCRPGACCELNAGTPDMPGVAYFSFAGEVPVARVTAPLRRAWHLLTAAEGPNDGMVSLASARWGEYLGTVHADHFAQTPDMKFIHPYETFDPLAFYCRILETLARRGF